MAFLDVIVFGVRFWILLYLGISIILGLIVLLYWKREAILKMYYTIRFPEKVIKVVIHYSIGLFKTFYRLVPEQEILDIEGKPYKYEDSSVVKKTDIFAHHQEGNPDIIEFIAEGKTYKLDKNKFIKDKSGNYPEIHYKYGLPYPINFNTTKSDIEFTSVDFKEFKDNDLFRKLLALEDEKNMIMMVMVLCGINLLATVFVIAKLMGWIK